MLLCNPFPTCNHMGKELRSRKLHQTQHRYRWTAIDIQCFPKCRAYLRPDNVILRIRLQLRHRHHSHQAEMVSLQIFCRQTRHDHIHKTALFRLLWSLIPAFKEYLRCHIIKGPLIIHQPPSVLANPLPHVHRPSPFHHPIYPCLRPPVHRRRSTHPSV